MNTPQPTIEAEVIPTEKPSQALAVRETGGAVSVKPMTVDELKENLRFIREVMQNVMAEGQDYGKIPGCGDKPSLLQPGAQKLCMTFQLQDRVRKEEVRDLPGSHREYAFTICLVSATGKEWDGVGTCSTMESKYRYRKAERRCPKCGHNTIIQGKAEYGGGWLCFKKKGGCGEKFPEADERITSQPGGTVEYENPPDYWNTVRKMAFKRALVHAAINATNTSELWTQDVEEMVENAPPRVSAAPEQAAAPAKAQPTRPPQKPAQQPAPAPVAHLKPATEATRDWMLGGLKALQGPGNQNRKLVTEYFQKIGQLLETEQLEDLPLRFVAITKGQLKDLAGKVEQFGRGDPAERAFPTNPDPEPPKNAPSNAKSKASANLVGSGTEAPYDPPAKPITVPREKVDQPEDQDAWRTFPMPWGGQAGVPLGELDKKYLYGLWANYAVETEYKGRPKKPETIAKDETFRAMLDLAGKHYEFTKKD